MNDREGAEGRKWRLKALGLARNLAVAQSALDMEAHCFPGDSWQNKQPAIEAAENALMAHLESADGVAPSQAPTPPNGGVQARPETDQFGHMEKPANPQPWTTDAGVPGTVGGEQS